MLLLSTLLYKFGDKLFILDNKKKYENLPDKIIQLLDFFNASSDVVMVCDYNLIIKYVNPAYTKLTGYKAKEVLDKNCKEANVDATAKILSKNNWGKINAGKTLNITCKNTKKNGEEYFLEKSIIPVHSKNKDKITHLIFSGKDTSEHLKTINKIIQSKRDLAEAQKISKLGFYVFNIINDSWISSSELNQIFGIKENFHKDFSSWSNLIHPDYKELMITYFTEEVLTKKKKFDLEYKIIDFKTGEEKWVHGLGNLKFDENQQPVVMFGTIQDITESKKIHQKLESNENALKEAQKIAKIGSWELDLVNNKLTWSDEIYRIFDSTPQSFGATYEAFLSFIHPDDRAVVNKTYTESVEQKTLYGPISHRLLLSNGKIKYVEESGHTTYNFEGKPICSFGVVQDITEKKITEYALIESEDKFRSIFHSLTAGMIIVIDDKGQIIEWNEGAELNFGYEKNEMFNKPLSMLMPERYREGHEKGLVFAAKNRDLVHKGESFELFGLHKNGEEFPIELSLGSWEREGKLFFSAIIIDVTERKEAERHLIRANSILEDIDSIVLLTNIKGEVIYTTSCIEKLIGYLPNEVMGNKWWELTFIGKTESDRVKGELISYLETNKIVRTTNHPRLVKCKDGTLKWFEWHNSKGVENCIISVGYDITYRILADQEINKLSRAIDQSPITVVITDLNGNIEYANPIFEESTGYSIQETKGKNPKIFKSGETSDKVYKELWETILAGKTWKGEFHNVKKDGTLYWERASIAPIFNRNGDIINFVALKEDITEKKATEKQLQFTLNNLENLVKARTEQLESALKKLEISLNMEKELGELKSKFVATASHQFRTPLTVIQANIGLLNMHVTTCDVQFIKNLERITTRIQSEVDRMTDLMNDVLILGKINAGSVQPDYKPTDILEIVYDITSKHNDIQEDGRVIDFKIIGNPHKLVIDAKLLKHTISNLISNAFKYSVGHPSPIITIHFEQKQVSISVKDFGMGIPYEDIKHLFQTFYRASNATDLPGTGLGIAIAKEYTELNGGTISFVSELNKGTEFTLVFIHN